MASKTDMEVNIERDGEDHSDATLLPSDGSVRTTHFEPKQAFKPIDTGEKPKVAVKRSRISALIHCLIHLPSITTTLGVLSLTFRAVFWQAPGPRTNSVLNALQFAAKVHESLIIISLSTMVLYYVRRALIGRCGVPLGLVSSGLQPNSVAYMFTGEFWGGATTKSQKANRRLPLVLSIVGAFVLANLAAPSSAITMIPRLDWWPVEKLWPEKHVSFSAYIHAKIDTLFPKTITKDSLPDYCFQNDAVLHGECPSRGISAVLANTEFLNNRDPHFWSNGPPRTVNITISSRFLDGSQSFLNQGFDSLFGASSIPEYIGSSLLGYYYTVMNWDYPSSNEASPLEDQVKRPLLKMSLVAGKQQSILYKPAVQVECGAAPMNSSVINFPHRLFMTPPWNDDAFRNANFSISGSSLSNIAVDELSGRINFTWIDLGKDKDLGPSLAGVFTMPKFASGASNDNAIYSCMIGANWIPTDPWIDPDTDMFVHEASPAPISDIVTSILGPDNGMSLAYTPIYIDRAWAESLNVKYNSTNSTTLGQTAMEAIGTACALSTGSGSNLSSLTVQDAGGFMAMQECLQMGMALYITDGLARMQSAIPTYFLATGYDDGIDSTENTPHIQDLDERLGRYTNLYPNITLENLHDTTNYTELRFEILQYGYGYGFRGVLIYIAVVVLLLHVLLVLIHMGYVVSVGLSSSAWANMGELLVLAINSAGSKQLRNTCAGVDKKKTWGLLASVRETSDDHLELIVGEEDGERDAVQLVPAKKYG